MKTLLIHTRKISKILLFIGLWSVLGLYTSKAQNIIPLKELYLNASRYHHKEITTEGYVKDYKEKISKKGNLYTVFKLTDGEYYVKVFTFGKVNLKENEKLKVTGTFYKIKYVGKYKFYNEITMEKFEIIE